MDSLGYLDIKDPRDLHTNHFFAIIDFITIPYFLSRYGLSNDLLITFGHTVDTEPMINVEKGYFLIHNYSKDNKDCNKRRMPDL